MKTPRSGSANGLGGLSKEDRQYLEDLKSLEAHVDRKHGIHKGPRSDCPSCNHSLFFKKKINGKYEEIEYWFDISIPRACTGKNWFLRMFGQCGLRSHHMHQTCRLCGAEWTCRPISSAEYVP